MEDTAELVSGRTLRCQVLDWVSRKHVHVIRSTYAAELHTLLDAINQGLLSMLHRDSLGISSGYGVVELDERLQAGIADGRGSGCEVSI